MPYLIKFHKNIKGNPKNNLLTYISGIEYIIDDKQYNSKIIKYNEPYFITFNKKIKEIKLFNDIENNSYTYGIIVDNIPLKLYLIIDYTYYLYKMNELINESINEISYIYLTNLDSIEYLKNSLMENIYTNNTKIKESYTYIVCLNYDEIMKSYQIINKIF